MPVAEITVAEQESDTLPRLRVVFDTNIYRQLSASRFAQIQRTERSHSVQAIPSPWVALELLAHMAPPRDKNFAPAHAALFRLAEHCRTYNGSQYRLTFIGDVYRQVAYSLLLFDVDEDESGPRLASFVGAIAEGAVDDPANSAGWQEFAERVREVEANFKRNIWENVVQASVPSAPSWSALSKSAPLLRDALAQLNSQETLRMLAEQVFQRSAQWGSTRTIDTDAALTRILSTCEKPLRFELELLSQVISAGLDLRKPRHCNTVWDIHIAVATTMFASLSTLPIWFVTDDKLVHRAAARAGVADLVIPLDSYEERLDNDFS